jgi:peptidyl-prolyl cis-trans isomerase D
MWFIAMIIVIPMAFWGIQEYFVGATDAPVAEVVDQQISQAAFRNALENQRNNVRQLMGDNVNNQFLDSIDFRLGVLNGLIQQVLISDVASSRGYRVGDEFLSELIRGSELFQNDGRFDAEAYQRYLIGQGQYSQSLFESRLREQTELSQVASGYAESSFILPGELSRLVELTAQQRGFSTATLQPAAFMDGIEVSEEQIVEYYDANQAQFYQPEQMKVAYLELSVADMMEDIQVGEDDLLAAWELQKAEYATQLSLTASHILIEADDEAALERATGLVAELRGGADFAELAKEHSDDIGSAQAGGELGKIEKGQMVEEFEAAAFALEPGQISDPVKTQYGYHIIRVDEINAPEILPYEDVRADLLDSERRRLAEIDYFEMADELQNLVYEQPDTLEGAAEELDLKIRTTDWFSANSGTGIAANPVIRQSAFSGLVMDEELNSDAIEVNEDTYFVIRKSEYKPESPEPLDAVRDDIRQLLRFTGAREKAAEQANTMLASLNSGDDWDYVTATGGIQGEYYIVARSDANLPVSRTIMDTVFAMNRPSEGQSFYSTVPEPGGGMTLIRLNRVDDIRIESASEQAVNSVRDALRQRHGDSYFGNYQQGLLKAAEPIINEELL